MLRDSVLQRRWHLSSVLKYLDIKGKRDSVEVWKHIQGRNQKENIRN